MPVLRFKPSFSKKCDPQIKICHNIFTPTHSNSKIATKLHKSCSPIVFTIILFFSRKKKCLKLRSFFSKKKISNDRVANYEQFLPTDLIASASYKNKQRKAMKAYV